MLGLTNDPGSIIWMTGSGLSWDARYQYLSGGVNHNPEYGWSTWNSPAGQFASYYMDASFNSGYLPVFTYYMLLQSAPASGSNENQKDYNNLNNPTTIAKYFADFKLLMDRAKIFNKPVIVHVEPDFWGYMQQRNANPAAISAAVASSGYGPVAAYSNTVVGFAQALSGLRNAYAPNVLLAFHVSPWASPSGDLGSSHDPNFNVQGAAQATANFYLNLGANFDLLFYDIADRDAAYYQFVIGDPNRWWDVNNQVFPNFNRFNQFALTITNATGKRGMLWQVPIGNKLYRSQNNSYGHYQDNRVQYYLGGGNNQHLQELAGSGIIGLLFGAGSADGSTYNDVKNDGITNPAAINGNNQVATLSDDDGGYLRYMAQAYYARGAVVLRITPPFNLQTNLPVTATQIPLSWSQNSNNESGFSLEARVGSSGNWNQINTLLANVTTYTASGLLNGTQYYFRVRAYAPGVYSVYSNITNPVTTAFPAPSVLNTTAARSNQVNLSWTDNSNSEQLFRLQRSPTGSNGSWTDLATVGPNVTTFADTTAVGNTTYYYQIRAENAFSNSAYSTAAAITTPPTEPSNLTATVASGTQINLTWSDNATGESGFHLDRKASLGGAWQATGANIGANSTSYNDTSLSAGTIYYYRIRAFSASGDSANSNEVSGITISSQVVTSISDTGDNTVPGSLSKALNAAANNVSDKTVTFNIGSPYIVIVSSPLQIPAGVTIAGICSLNGPGIKITAANSGLTGMQLLGNTVFYGVNIYGFQGPQLKIPLGAGGNKFSCTKFG